MCSSGTNEYICRIVDRYSRMLHKLALTRLSPTDAEDVVQEVLIKLMTTLPKFRDEEHEKAWLIRATMNRACDFHRAAAKATVPIDQLELPAREDEAQLLSAVRTLPGKYSAVIHLYYYEGYSIKEIAKLLRLPASTVGSRLARGRARLKEIIKEDFE